MSSQKVSGISRAIAIAGNQAALSRLIWHKCRVLIYQSRISEGERSGYVSQRVAELIAQVTGVPVEDLIRQGKREHRRVARRKTHA